MLVEKELIEQAKEKLGDQNAFLMAELLELENFDEKNLKALSPYRKEDTASFVYDRKKYRFKDFGGSKNVDIIDVLMESGKTFIDACKWLFEKTEMEYQFGEHHVATKAKYKYPPAESYDNDRTKAYEYLKSRGISKSVCDYLDIRADKRGNIAFHTYNCNDVLMVVNCRVPHTVKNGQFKCWFAADENELDDRGKPTPYGTEDLLFNMNRINPNKPLVITEGQIDCASVIEAGYTNVVSVLKGSGDLKWVETCSDFLDQFSEIIIASDNDEPGIKMRNNAINMLGSWRCKYIDIPKELEYRDTGKKYKVTDLNECLQSCGAEYVMSLINNAKDLPMTNIVQMEDIEEENIYDMEGFKSGFNTLDNEYYKFFMKNVTIITGSAGAGKSTLLNTIALNAMDSGYNTLLLSYELINNFACSWVDKVAAGPGNMKQITTREGDKFDVLTEEAKRGIRKFYNDKLYIYKDDASNEEDALFETMEECIRKKNCRVILIDGLMCVLLNEDSEGQNKAQTRFMSRLVAFCKKWNCAIFIVMHLRKPQGKDNVESSLSDIAGSSNLGNLAHRTIGIKRIKKDDYEDPKSKYYGYQIAISSLKDRMTGFMGEIPMRYDKVSHRIYNCKEEYCKNYAWDEYEGNSNISYPSVEREQFPDK